MNNNNNNNNDDDNIIKINWNKVYTVKAGGIFFEPADNLLSCIIRLSSEFYPLVTIPSPRDIPSVKYAIYNYLYDVDKVWFKYWPQKAEPYKHIKEYFLSRRQKYTHLIILPDDLIINGEGINRLFNTVLSNPEKYKVLMGDCPISYTDKTYTSFTKNLPSLKRSERFYDWYKRKEVKGKGIIQVKHSGIPFAIFHREIVEKLSFDTDAKWNSSDTQGSAEDIVISNELNNLNIPIYVDTDAVFTHLKGSKEAFLVY